MQLCILTLIKKIIRVLYLPYFFFIAYGQENKFLTVVYEVTKHYIFNVYEYGL